MLKILTILGFPLFLWVLWRLFSRHYSLPCPSWLGWLINMDNPFTQVTQAATLIQHLDLQPGMTVLDVGCGPGRLAIPVAQKVGPEGRVVAMDIQDGMLQRVQKKAKAANLTNIKCFQEGIGQGKLEQGKFDRVLLVSVLGEVLKQDTALKEIFEALKPDGILSVTETIFDPHFQSRTKVLKLAESIGFKEKCRFGNFIAFTINLCKPKSG